MKTTLQSGPAYRLDVSLERGAYGTVLKLLSYMPLAKNPGEHVQFQTTLSDDELKNFQKVLTEAVASATI